MNAELQQREEIIKEHIVFSHLMTFFVFSILLLYTIPEQWPEMFRNLTFFNSFFLVIFLLSLVICARLLNSNIELQNFNYPSYCLYFAVPLLFTVTILLTGMTEILFLRLFYFAPLVLSVINFKKEFGYIALAFTASNFLILNIYQGLIYTTFDLLFLLLGTWFIWLLGTLFELERKVQLEIRREGKSNLQDLQIKNYEQQINKLRAQKHDFGNHLQVILTMLQMNKTARAVSYIKSIVESSGTEALAESALGNTTVDSLLLAKKEAALDKGIHFKIDITGDLSLSAVPSQKMSKILFNLIDNAIEALQSSSQSEKEISVTVAEEPQSYLIEVANNGPPIPPELKDSIFEIGVSQKDTDQRRRGYGLYIISGILREYGGEIHVESDRERTVFTCTFPKK